MASDSRPITQTLARKGFRFVETASQQLARLPGISAELVDQIGTVASPDTALSSIEKIAESYGADRLFALLDADAQLSQRLLIVLGTSAALGEFLARHPEFLTDLGADQLSTNALPIDEQRRQLGQAKNSDELRIHYRRNLLHIAARDLNAYTSFEESSAELADLAVATLGAALALAHSDTEDARLCRLAVMAMGKTGGRELNYISDVDVIFVYEPSAGADDNLGRCPTRVVSRPLAHARRC